MGKSHVRHFVAEGARVVLGDVLDDKGAAVADGLGGQCCRYVHHDVTSEQQWAAAVTAAVDTFGRLDVLVNNAGVLKFARIADMPPADFRHILDVNAVGCWLGMKAVIGPLTAAGGGSIINISSIEGFAGASGLSAYSASKFAVRGMTKVAFLLGSPGQPNYAAAKAGIAALTVTTARSCARYGVTANAICPRARTAMTADLMGPPPDAAVDPLDPRHVAPLVVHLASPAAAGINGEVFVVHGGIAAVMEPPKIRATFLAADHGSADGMWTLESVRRALGPMSAAAPPRPAGFACEGTLALAAGTIGFAAPEGGAAG